MWRPRTLARLLLEARSGMGLTHKAARRDARSTRGSLEDRPTRPLPRVRIHASSIPGCELVDRVAGAPVGRALGGVRPWAYLLHSTSRRGALSFTLATRCRLKRRYRCLDPNSPDRSADLRRLSRRCSRDDQQPHLRWSRPTAGLPCDDSGRATGHQRRQSLTNTGSVSETSIDLTDPLTCQLAMATRSGIRSASRQW